MLLQPNAMNGVQHSATLSLAEHKKTFAFFLQQVLNT